ncbi:MAG: peptidylprolyl isomerase [Candidatus Aminicenantes bacterium]|nr:peptidylprolyl isomerase [Candidatus Aminicenantes bacterium]
MRTWAVVILAAAAAIAEGNNPVVVVKTEVGEFTVEVYADEAPLTAANFMKYVEAGLYDGTVFHRSVTPDSPRNRPVQIEVIQGGQVAGEKSFPAIALERTSATGVKHVDGAISMARGGPDTATSSFFICVGDQPELDFGGKRNPDGQGFAAFGRVVAGMDVVRRIHRSPVNEAEQLTPPVKILSITRYGSL